MVKPVKYGNTWDTGDGRLWHRGDPTITVTSPVTGGTYETKDGRQLPLLDFSDGQQATYDIGKDKDGREVAVATPLYRAKDEDVPALRHSKIAALKRFGVTIGGVYPHHHAIGAPRM